MDAVTRRWEIRANSYKYLGTYLRSRRHLGLGSEACRDVSRVYSRRLSYVPDEMDDVHATCTSYCTLA